MGFIFSLFGIVSAGHLWFSVPQYMQYILSLDFPVSSFVSLSTLLTGKGDLAVARDGFPLQQRSSIFFIVPTMIAEGAF